MKIYYRLSNQNASVRKQKLPHATKEYCLKNTVSVFGLENITVVGDNLNVETEEMVNSLGVKLVKVNNGSGAGTFRSALDLAIEENSDEEIIYLLEDDFLHKPEAAQIIEEGVKNFNTYVTGYDHPDKYMNKHQGGNPLIEYGGEVTRLVRTQSTHWKITNSTVMSFAASRQRLLADKELLYKYSVGKATDSFKFFLELTKEKGTLCLSSVPGVSTHVEQAWLTPFTDWNKI